MAKDISFFVYFLGYVRKLAVVTAGGAIFVGIIRVFVDGRVIDLAAISAMGNPALADFLHEVGTSATLTIWLAFSMVMYAASFLFERYLQWRTPRRFLGTSDETAAASERTVAATADTLTRDFQARIQKEIDAAVTRLAAASDKVITSQLAQRIDETVGANLVAVLGEQLAKQTNEQHRLNDFRQISLDTFVQMRSRSIQYADSAQKQSAFFRWIAVGLSMGGLGTLAILLYQNYQQFMANPELVQTHAEWTMVVLRNGPAYTFVLLYESLALVMFRYQSRSLEFMRYFSNEGTNLDARRVAFMSALFYDDKAAMKNLIEKLESTERNFLIDKNQRTLELANNDLEDRMVDKLFNRLSRGGTSDHQQTVEDEKGKTHPVKRRGK